MAAAKAATGVDPCSFARAWPTPTTAKHLIALRTPLSVVVLNRFPYNNGHLLVAPRATRAGSTSSTPSEIARNHGTRCGGWSASLDRLMRPDGFNVGLNLGSAAGAGLPGHLHWHIVPRWNGDTNFMPVLADTKVIVQSLEALYDLLRDRQLQSHEGSRVSWTPPTTAF